MHEFLKGPSTERSITMGAWRTSVTGNDTAKDPQMEACNP